MKLVPGLLPAGPVLAAAAAKVQLLLRKGPMDAVAAAAAARNLELLPGQEAVRESSSLRIPILLRHYQSVEDLVTTHRPEVGTGCIGSRAGREQ
jgi:hypothetical protein